jgi:hypothetical protein
MKYFNSFLSNITSTNIVHCTLGVNIIFYSISWYNHYYTQIIYNKYTWHNFRLVLCGFSIGTGLMHIIKN